MIETIINIFNAILYRPIFNVLVLFYNYLPGKDFGISIILLTLIIRLILYPTSAKAIKSQKTLNQIQPKIKEIQEKYKDNKEKQAEEIMNLYKKEKFNPFGGCLPILIQLPILIALFQVLKAGFSPEQLAVVYNFIPTPEKINPLFLGIVNLTEVSIVIALFAGVLQFFQTKMMSMNKKEKKKGNKKGDFASMMQKQMLYFFPFITFFILLRLPSAIGLYWIVNSLFSIGQQYLIFKNKND